MKFPAVKLFFRRASPAAGIKRWVFPSALIFLVFYCNGFVYAVTILDMNKVMSRWAEEFGEIAPEAANTGLSTADAYIGQLLGFPSHWSFGLTINPMFVPIEKVSEMSKELFNVEIHSNYRAKLLLPIYSLDGRLGGFLGWPFDIGFRLSVLPEAPLWDAVSFGYYSAGGDLRIRVFYDSVSKTVASASLFYNYFEGMITGSFYSGPGDITAGGAAAGKIGWDTNAIGFRLAASLPIFNITFFSGVLGGYALTNVKWRVNANNDPLTVSSAQDGASYGGTYSTATNGHYEVQMAANSPFAELYSGISLDFRMRLDLCIYVNPITLSAGVRFAIRYQQ